MRRLARLWPPGLAGRTTLVLLVGLLTLHLGSVWVHEATLRGTDRAAREQALRDGLAQAGRALRALPEAARDRAAHALSTPGLELHWRDRPPKAAAAVGDAVLPALRARLVANEPELAALLLGWGDTERHMLVGTLPVGDGALSFAAPLFRNGHGGPFDPAGFLSLAAMAIGIAIASVLVVRGLTRPLRDLSAAADRIGREAGPVRVVEAGPTEVRQAARAFNAMQDRIRRLVDDRTQALAAVSHDLRTPITRLRLRAGFLDDTEARDRIDADLDEMEGMVEATLAYLREGREAEERRATDLVAILRTVCDAATDAGGEVALSAPETLVLPLRRLGMKRALTNLVANAVTHGGGGAVIVTRDAEGVVIEVADRGPGIPDAELERVFEPFRRLEDSRGRATGGVGLGLAIARRAIEAEGGTVRLANRPGGGLIGTVRLPNARQSIGRPVIGMPAPDHSLAMPRRDHATELGARQ